MNEQNAKHEPVADVREAIWHWEDVNQLLDDLNQHADIHRVQVRRRNLNGPPTDAAVTLKEAVTLLQEGQAQAVQIYYRFERKAWCDTLFPTSGAFRIVRTVLPNDQVDF